MKVGIIAALLAGLAIATALIAYSGFAEISGLLLSAGWGLVAASLLHLLPAALSSMAWRSQLPYPERKPLLIFLTARLVREGASHLLPLAQVGAEIIGARVLTLFGSKAGMAGAAVVVDLSMEVVSQFLFTLIGLLLLVLSGVHDRTVFWLFIGLGAMLPLLGGFVLAQRRGMFKTLEVLVENIADKWPWMSLGKVDGLHDTIHQMYGNHRSLLIGATLHLLAWVLGAAEVWLALYFMGHTITLYQAFILESLGMAIRGAAFLIPGALGVQEGGLMLVSAMLGLSPDIGLALSLAKRVRDILLGVPALLKWQLLEGRKIWGNGGANTPRS
jgi:putative membrane protein